MKYLINRLIHWWIQKTSKSDAEYHAENERSKNPEEVIVEEIGLFIPDDHPLKDYQLEQKIKELQDGVKT